MGPMIRSIAIVSVCACVCLQGSQAAAQDSLPTPAEALPYPTTGFSGPPLLTEPLADITPIEAVPNLLPAPQSETAIEVLPANPPLPTAPAVEAPAEPPAPSPESIATPEPAAVDDLILTDPTVTPITWYRPTSWFGPAPWDTGVELGVNGSSGTSNTLSVRTGGYVKRKTDTRKIDFNLYYNKTNSEGVDTQNNAQLNFRHDWLLGDSPWTVYFNNQLFYDEFQAFDLNVNLNTGIGYTWFEDDWVSLVTRYGSGASREFGGPEDRWKPEAQFGLDFEQKISKTQKFYAKVDYFPEWESFGDYRILADLGMEVQLSVPSNVSLKIAATDRYQSNPNGVEPHNVNYSVLLLWKH